MNNENGIQTYLDALIQTQTSIYIQVAAKLVTKYSDK